jgi:hypothetical protein
MSTLAVAGPPIWPGYHISRIALTLSAHGMQNKPPFPPPLGGPCFPRVREAEVDC